MSVVRLSIRDTVLLVLGDEKGDKMLARLNFLKVVGTAAIVIGVPSILAASSRGTIGDVVQSTQTLVNGAAVPSEWSLANGDQVNTGPSGKALVMLSPDNDLRLAENTSVTFDERGGRVTANVASGTLGTETLAKDAVVVKTPLVTFEPAGQGGSAYWVQVGPDQTVVSANRGSVKITEIATGEIRIVPEGNHALISQAPAPDQPPTAGIPQTEEHRKKFIVIIVILAGIAALGLGLGIWAILNSGPSSPSNP